MRNTDFKENERDRERQREIERDRERQREIEKDREREGESKTLFLIKTTTLANRYYINS